jgi:hypothetical protein
MRMSIDITPEFYRNKRAEFSALIDEGDVKKPASGIRVKAAHASYASSWLYLLFNVDLTDRYVVQYRCSADESVSTHYEEIHSTIHHSDFSYYPIYGVNGTLTAEQAEKTLAMLQRRYHVSTSSRLKIVPAREYALEKFQYHLSIIER